MPENEKTGEKLPETAQLGEADIRRLQDDLPNDEVLYDLADIYQDIKDFIFIFQLGLNETMNDSLVICKENFGNIWGQKLVNTLRALHDVKYNTSPFEDEEESEEEDDHEHCHCDGPDCDCGHEHHHHDHE